MLIREVQGMSKRVFLGCVLAYLSLLLPSYAEVPSTLPADKDERSIALFCELSDLVPTTLRTRVPSGFDDEMLECAMRLANRDSRLFYANLASLIVRQYRIRQLTSPGLMGEGASGSSCDVFSFLYGRFALVGYPDTKSESQRLMGRFSIENKYAWIRHLHGGGEIDSPLLRAELEKTKWFEPLLGHPAQVSHVPFGRQSSEQEVLDAVAAKIARDKRDAVKYTPIVYDFVEKAEPVHIASEQRYDFPSVPMNVQFAVQKLAGSTTESELEGDLMALVLRVHRAQLQYPHSAPLDPRKPIPRVILSGLYYFDVDHLGDTVPSTVTLADVAAFVLRSDWYTNPGEPGNCPLLQKEIEALGKAAKHEAGRPNDQRVGPGGKTAKITTGTRVSDSPTTATAPVGAEGPLTAELARKALVSMVESLPKYYDFPKMSLPDLKSDPIGPDPTVSAGASQLRCGRWWINLDAHKFGFSVINPPHIFFSMWGEFAKDGNGGWAASVKGNARN
jgi:hypothetical protein